MKCLICAADDFGLTKSINEGIVKAHREGIVTYINALPSGEAFGDASRLAGELRLNEMGAHLSLTETVPVSDPSRIPTLVTKDGRFHKDRFRFFTDLFLGKIERDHIFLELKSQLEALKRLGIALTNISSHEHIHMMPAILNIFVSLSREYGIPSIRYPRKDRLTPPLSAKKILRKALLSYFEKRTEEAFKRSQIAYPDILLGFLDSGCLREDTLIAMLKTLGDGASELVSHPGFLGPEILDRYTFHMDCEAELFALTSRRVKKIIEDNGIKLISYSEFFARRA